jgi:hypothetical protein
VWNMQWHASIIDPWARVLASDGHGGPRQRSILVYCEKIVPQGLFAAGPSA